MKKDPHRIVKTTVSCSAALFLFLFLITHPGQCFDAAAEGLLLWSRSLVPTLFPAMLLCGLLVRTNAAWPLLRILGRPLEHFLGVSPYGTYALAVGFFCGCPMGAKVLCDLCESGRIDRSEAAYLARFCNNLSPSFLTNFLVASHLKDMRLAAPTLSILLGAPLLYGLFSNLRFQFLSPDNRLSQEKNRTSPTPISFGVVDACISDSILNITKLGGYIILFSVCASSAGSLFGRDALAPALFCGVLEVSTGIHAIAGLSLPFAINYLLLIAVSAFGGLCCAAQSAAMLRRIGLPLQSYLASKLSVTAIAVLMAACYAL